MRKSMSARDEALSVTAGTETFEIKGPDDLRDDLLPGIPNDLAWQVIAPKLSGKDINTLSFVSPSWHEAIHRRWVYDARVRSHSTETLAVVLYSRRLAYKLHPSLRLYPVNENSAYDLPPILFERVRKGCKCTPLEGKIYILGGATPGPTRSRESCSGSKKLVMLDLAGRQQWKQCASIQEGRLYFSAGVLDGKVYVIGVRHNGQSVYKCEVYGPKVDAWSSIADLTPLRVENRVAAIGGELFVYGGFEWTDNPRRETCSRYVVAYKNEWRQLGHFNGECARESMGPCVRVTREVPYDDPR